MRIPIESDTREQRGYEFKGYDVALSEKYRPPGMGDLGVAHPKARVAIDRKGLRDFRSWLVSSGRRRHQIDQAARMGVELHIVVECSEAEFWADEFTVAKVANILRILAGDRMKSIKLHFAGSRQAGERLAFELLRADFERIAG